MDFNLQWFQLEKYTMPPDHLLFALNEFLELLVTFIPTLLLSLVTMAMLHVVILLQEYAELQNIEAEEECVMRALRRTSEFSRDVHLCTEQVMSGTMTSLTCANIVNRLRLVGYDEAIVHDIVEKEDVVGSYETSDNEVKTKDNKLNMFEFSKEMKDAYANHVIYSENGSVCCDIDNRKSAINIAPKSSSEFKFLIAEIKKRFA